MLSDDQAMEIIKTLADANRFQLFRRLLRSDHTNSELMEFTQLSQNLLSHHLNVLSSAGLIEAQRSIGDARRHYYSANLDVVNAFGRWWDAATFRAEAPIPVVEHVPDVLFLCMRNSTRSLMAQALARHMAPGTLRAWSAGVLEGGRIEPSMLRVLGEFQVSAEGLEPTIFSQLGKRDFDYVITVCDIVHECSIPTELHAGEMLHWSLHDPAASPDPDRQYEDTRQLYYEIAERLRAFVQRLVLGDRSGSGEAA